MSLGAGECLAAKGGGVPSAVNLLSNVEAGRGTLVNVNMKHTSRKCFVSLKLLTRSPVLPFDQSAPADHGAGESGGVTGRIPNVSDLAARFAQLAGEYDSRKRAATAL